MISTALVIGGNRYFGKRLVEILLDAGVKVTVLNRGSLNNSERVSWIKCDRTDSVELQKCVKGKEWDIVFDQACFTPKDATSIIGMLQGKIGRYVLTSSQSVYEYGQNLTEHEFEPRKYPLKGDASNLSYKEGKRLAEAVFFRDGKFHVVAVRFPIVLGHDDYTKRLEFHIDRIRDGRTILMKNTEAKLSFISSEDAGRFLHFIGAMDFVGPINCCSPDAISINALVGEIESRVGKKAIISSSDGDQSPFGVENDWTMDNSLATKLGFQSHALSIWLPELIRIKTGGVDGVA